MENTNTDARKAAQEILKRKVVCIPNLDGSEGMQEKLIIDAMLEFAQSRPATLEEVSDKQIEEAADEFYNNTSLWPSFRTGVRWRESLSEQPEAKPTEAEQVEKWRKRFIKNLDNAKLAEQGEYNEGFVQGITVGLAIFDEVLNSLKQ